MVTKPPIVLTQEMVAMKTGTDCEVAALATATGKSYDQAKAAIGYLDLPGQIESPIFSNPANVSRAAASLGYLAVECGLSSVLEYRAAPGRVLVLVHDQESPTLNQHWIVWLGGADGWHAFAWGDGTIRWYKSADLVPLVTAGKPNSVMELTSASSLTWWRWLWWYLRYGIRWR